MKIKHHVMSSLAAVTLMACAADDAGETGMREQGVSLGEELRLFDYAQADSASRGNARSAKGEARARVNREALSDAPAAPVRLALPSGEQFDVHADGTERRDHDDLVWHGRFSGTSGEGHGVLTVHAGHVAGRLWLAGKSYAVTPSADGSKTVEVLEVDPASMPDCGVEDHDHGALDARLAGPKATPQATSSADSHPIIDVMGVYTPLARDAAGGVAQIETLLQSSIDVTNLAYANSDVQQRVNLVAAELFDYDEAGIDLGIQLDDLRSNAAINALRDTHAADLVAMITENGAGFCGMAYVMRTVDVGFESMGFSVTQRDCAVGNLSFPHELGHNMGLEHDRANGAPPEQASFPFSFGHFVDGEFRTVMSYASGCTAGCTRVPHFSNPDVLFNGFPTGVEDVADAARALDLTGPVVAAFRDGEPAGTNPCAGICENPTVFSSNNFSSGNLGSGERCFETTSTLTSGNCGNFASGRTLEINGVPVACNYSNIALPAARNGGYCFDVSAGGQNWAFLNTW